MIQPESLRIGNYVNCFGTREVISIGKKKVKLQRYKDGTYYTEKAPYNSFDVAPIPLNKDWLLRLGFIKTHRGKFEHDMLAYDIYGSNGLYMHGVSVEIKYVHQLQNLFYCLTDKELTLKE